MRLIESNLPVLEGEREKEKGGGEGRKKKKRKKGKNLSLRSFLMCLLQHWKGKRWEGGRGGGKK